MTQQVSRLTNQTLHHEHLHLLQLQAAAVRLTLSFSTPVESQAQPFGKGKESWPPSGPHKNMKHIHALIQSTTWRLATWSDGIGGWHIHRAYAHSPQGVEDMPQKLYACNRSHVVHG